MCTGQRGYYICPCRNLACPKRGVVPHRNIIYGHVCHIEVDTLAWEICEWWIANGPPEQVLNRYLKPSCIYFAWHTLMINTTICEACKITCAKSNKEGGKDAKKAGESSQKKT